MQGNLFDIKDRVVVITGGTGVLGGSMSKYLLENGAKVAVIGSRQESVDNRLEELKDFGDQVTGFRGSVLEKAEMQQIKDQVIDKWGRIDTLINGAGGNRPDATVSPDQTVFDISVEEVQKVLDLNLQGSIIPSLIFGEDMAKKQKQGSVINISSMASTHAITRVMGYSIAKAGIDNFTKWLSTEFAMKFGDGMRVNAIAPGFFISNQNRRLLTNEDGSLTDRGNTIIANTPMGRFGDAEELNGIVHYLVSDASKFVTGTIIPIDGGFSSFSGV